MKKLINPITIGLLVSRCHTVPVASNAKNPDSLWSVWNDVEQADTARLRAIDWLIYQGFNEKTFSYDSVFDLSQRMYELASKNDLYEYQSKALVFMGHVERERRNYDEALTYYQERLKIGEESGDQKGVAKAYRLIGSVHNSNYNLREALKFHSLSLDASKAISDTFNIAVQYFNVGFAYYTLYDFKNAWAYYDSSLWLHEKLKDTVRIFDRKRNSAGMSLKLGD